MNETPTREARLAYEAAREAYLTACLATDHARNAVRAAAAHRAFSAFNGTEVGMTRLYDLGDALTEAERAEGVRYNELWRVANGEEA